MHSKRGVGTQFREGQKGVENYIKIQESELAARKNGSISEAEECRCLCSLSNHPHPYKVIQGIGVDRHLHLSLISLIISSYD